MSLPGMPLEEAFSFETIRGLQQELTWLQSMKNSVDDVKEA